MAGELKAVELTEAEIVAFLLWRFAAHRFVITDAELQRFIDTRLTLIPAAGTDALTLTLVKGDD